VSFEALGSPVYARLAEHLADDPELVSSLVGDDEGWDAPLRLFAAVHYLVLTALEPKALSGRWEDFAEALATRGPLLRDRVASYGVQTNEVQRCTFLVPAFRAAAAKTGLPLDLLELGPSAGLNLLADRYRCSYVNGSSGPADSRVELTTQEGEGLVPARLLSGDFVVRRRLGIDLAPVDATTEDGYLLLRSYVWPGLDDRVARLDAAVATLRDGADRLELIEGDYVRLLPELLARRPDDALTVVVDTFSTVFLPSEASAELAEVLETAGADGRPLAWVSVRPWDERAGPPDGRFELELRVWPGAPRLAAYVDPHGNVLDWRLPAP
jgi:hypothetical protein